MQGFIWKKAEKTDSETAKRKAYENNRGKANKFPTSAQRSHEVAESYGKKGRETFTEGQNVKSRKSGGVGSAMEGQTIFWDVEAQIALI